MKFKIGDQVTHKEFGDGEVVRKFRWYNAKIITVQFDMKHPDLHDGDIGYNYHCFSFTENDEELKLIKE
jgi:hypothetical protein